MSKKFPQGSVCLSSSLASCLLTESGAVLTLGDLQNCRHREDKETKSLSQPPCTDLWSFTQKRELCLVYITTIGFLSLVTKPVL
jgi:hypothetical protein